ncbi:MAG: hypothetical protein M1828_000964 [Chrysothrix sp. TS-e1954]|nr:MAG: hypothetical protein M1828_000964 [Chrysothrix sp. TS-e1954]
MPKDFETPLTCFYWSNGGCSKSADECWYAHYETGVRAAAPVKVDESTVSVAGVNATFSIDGTDRHRDLTAREWKVKKAEQDLKEGRVELASQTSKLSTVVERFKKTLEKTQAAASNLYRGLAVRLSDPLSIMAQELEASNAMAASQDELTVKRITNTMALLDDLEKTVGDMKLYIEENLPVAKKDSDKDGDGKKEDGDGKTEDGDGKKEDGDGKEQDGDGKEQDCEQ